MDFNTCCAYCCTGLSAFGIVGLISFGYILQHGGNWYMNISNEAAPSAATGCYIAAAIYAGYLFFCGYRVLRLATTAKKPLANETYMDEHYA